MSSCVSTEKLYKRITHFIVNLSELWKWYHLFIHASANVYHDFIVCKMICKHSEYNEYKRPQSFRVQTTESNPITYIKSYVFCEDGTMKGEGM